MFATCKQIVVGLSVVAISAGVGITPAAAASAPPTNDLVAQAVAIPALPFNTALDTSGATTDAVDAALNAQCGAPATNGSVWYTYTPPTGVAGLLVDVSASSYSSGVIIAHSDGVGGYLVDTCGAKATGTLVNAGTTYTILAFSDTPGVIGGTLRLHAEAAAVPTVSATVNPRGKVDQFGNALISGTYICTGGSFIELNTSVTQPVGRFAITGQGFTGSNEPCDGLSHAWTTVVVPSNGKFAGGKAATFTFAFSCGTVFCADSFVQQAVRLSR